MDLILRPIKRRPQMLFSMARKFKLQLLRRYSVKFSKMRNFTLGTPWLGKLKNTGRRLTSILRICTLWLYHCATVTCDTYAIYLWYLRNILRRYKHFSPYFFFFYCFIEINRGLYTSNNITSIPTPKIFKVNFFSLIIKKIRRRQQAKGFPYTSWTQNR